MLKPELINGRASSHLIKQGSYDRHIEFFLTLSQNKKPHRETFIHSSPLHVQTTCICLLYGKTKWTPKMFMWRSLRLDCSEIYYKYFVATNLLINLGFLHQRMQHIEHTVNIPNLKDKILLKNRINYMIEW